MATIVALNTEILHRFVFELRYDFGQLYWDRAGKISRTILSTFDDWNAESIQYTTSRLSNHDLNMGFSYGPEKLDLSQTQDADVETLVEVGDFAKTAEDVSNIIVENLNLESFSRIGFRSWLLYPTTDRNHANELMSKLSLFRLNTQNSKVLQNVSEASYRVVTDRNTYMLRIALSPFEQDIKLPPSVLQKAKQQAHNKSKDQHKTLIDQLKAKKRIEHYPQFGILLDFDAFLENPPVGTDLRVSDFITGAFADISNIKAEVLASTD